MKRLLNKELRLAASPLSYCFLAFSLIALLPGYPILMGAFFVCFGIFQSFQIGRETNDILYTVLLPIRKRDVVKARFLFVSFIQWTGFALMAALTVLRMTALSAAPPYVNNALMNANPLFLAFVLLIYAAFNLLFVRGFFRTAYRIGRPFICFVIMALLLTAAAETLHHLPGLAFLNATGWDCSPILWLSLIAAAVQYGALTMLAYRASAASFERVDL